MAKISLYVKLNFVNTKCQPTAPKTVATRSTADRGCRASVGTPSGIGRTTNVKHQPRYYTASGALPKYWLSYYSLYANL